MTLNVNHQDHVSISKGMLRTGMVLPADVYIHLKLNNSTVLYRKAGDQLASADLVRIANVPDGGLTVLKTELPKFAASAGGSIKNALRSGDLGSEEVRQSAASLLSSVGAGGGENPEGNGLSELPKIVEEIVLTLKQTPSLQTYSKILEEARKNEDPLTRHNRQVSAMAVLLMMSIGGGTMDDLGDLGAAGIVHDVGLLEGPRVILETHVRGEDNFSPSEKIFYLRHSDSSIEILLKQKISVSPGVIRIVEHHHENWDGSGFKGLSGAQIYRNSRILRIADEMIGQLQDSTDSESFRIVLSGIALAVGKNMMPIFDPQAMSELRKLL